jgi:hypothetical protein
MRKLTAKQQAFAHFIADGLEQATAYRKAYDCPNSSPSTVKVEASRTAALPHVAEFIRTLKGQHDQKKFLTRERKREILQEIAESKGESIRPNERVKAIEVDNIMTGDNAPQQVEVFGLTELLGIVRKGS